MITLGKFGRILLCITALQLAPSIYIQSAYAQTSAPQLQTHQLTGQLVDTFGKPIELGAVSLLNTKGILQTGTITDAKGHFILNTTASATEELNLSIQVLGYKYYTRKINYQGKPLELGRIILEEETETLGDVVVRADRQAVRMRGTTLRAEVASTALSSLPTALDVLGQIPFVSANNQEISVLGRGVPHIYIGHRQVELEEVRRLDPKTIKNIEVLMSPGAEYNASIGAVIRITLRGKQTGKLGGNIRSDLTQDYKIGYYLSGNIYHHGEKLDVSVGATARRSFSQSDMLLRNELIFPSTHVYTEREQSDHDKRLQVQPWLNLIYSITPKQELGAKYELFSNLQYNNYADYKLLERHSGQDFARSTGIWESHNVRPFTQHNANLYYHNQLSENWALHADIATFLRSEARHTKQALEYSFPQKRTREINSDTESNSSVLGAKGYIQGKTLGGELKTGLELTLSQHQQAYRADNPDNPTLLPPSENTNRQEYLALFGEWSRPLSERWSLGLGLRTEAVRTAYQSASGAAFAINPIQWYLFPNLTLGYNMGQWQFALDYRSQIERPSYNQLRNSYTYIDDYLLETGNPQLRPSIQHGLGLSASYQGLSISLRSAFVQDDILDPIRLHPTNNQVMVLERTNLNTWLHEAYLSYSLRWGIWTPTWSAGLRHTAVPGSEYKELPYASLFWRNILSLPQGWSIKANIGSKLGGTQYNVRLYGAWWIDLAVSKEFGKHWQISLWSNDLLTTGQEELDILGPGVKLYKLANSDQVNVTLSVSYRFDVKSRRYRGGEAGASEVGRL